LIDERDVVGRYAEQARGVRARVADGGGGAQESDMAPVKARHPDETRDDVRHVRAEHAAIGVQLVQDDEPEAGEEARPRCVVRKDAGAQHIGVGHDDRPEIARRASRVPRRVAVVDHA
jgi:hypothetical protein